MFDSYGYLLTHLLCVHSSAEIGPVVLSVVDPDLDFRVNPDPGF
jgi:hypothetical protein